LKIKGLLSPKKKFLAASLESFRKRKALGEKSSIVSNVSKQTLEEGKGIKNSDLLAKMCFCLKSSSLSENRHGKKMVSGCEFQAASFDDLVKSPKRSISVIPAKAGIQGSR
jgi:hypothetical protein